MESFRIILYGLILPYILYISIKQNNIILFLCFLSILLAHLYSEYKRKTVKNWKWGNTFIPGIILGLLLIISTNNKIIKLIGIIKIIGEFKRNILGYTEYYY